MPSLYIYFSQSVWCVCQQVWISVHRGEKEEEGKKEREGGREKRAVSDVCISLNVTATQCLCHRKRTGHKHHQ